MKNRVPDTTAANACLRVTAVHMAATALGMAMCQSVPAQVHGFGISSLGATGGLVIPSAYVLESGDLAVSAGNYQDPKLGTFGKKQNYTLGIGLLPRVEVFGRFADYQNPQLAILPGFVTGPRDISVNVKWQLPFEVRGLPKLAVGATDASGGAVYFSSKYLVASDEYESLRWSLGYARGKPALGQSGNPTVLNGVFGGAEFRLGNTGATALAESDGTRRHVGMRYYSEAMPWLANSQVVGTVQRSIGGTTLPGRAAESTVFNVSLILPMGATDKTRQKRTEDITKPLPPLTPASAAPAVGGMVASAQDRLDSLSKSLRATGIDRVRVGTLGKQLIVEYENRLYLHNEADALGIVLGLAAEYAPTGIEQVRAVSTKSGLELYETSIDVAAYRMFLRDGNAAPVKDALEFSLSGNRDAKVQWEAADAGDGRRKNWLRMELKPLLNYTLGTEFGAFDYSLAANVRTSTSLWKGAEAYVDVVQRVANSSNIRQSGVFANLLHKNGVKTVALQQSFWVGSNLFASVGAGQFDYKARGVEGESIFSMPDMKDTVHVKGSYLRNALNALSRDTQAYSGSYRWKLDDNTWIEPSFNKYTDRSTGPSLTMTRWFGDVSLQLAARKGGNNTFVGAELSLPLGPRKGLAAGPVVFGGTPRYVLPFRTLLTKGGNSGNFVDIGAVRPVNLNYKPEVELFNSGRVTPDYIKNQVQRMREAFYLYARSEVN